MEFIEVLKERNPVLYWVGMVNLVAVLVFITFSIARPIQFGGTNAWFKPIKFALSTTILLWTVGWFSGHLTPGKHIEITNWILVVTLAFEVIYIAWQAARGQASHFNISTPFYTTMYSLMALAATAATLAAGYIGLLFCMGTFPDLPVYYVWGIRFGFLLFVIFSFQGFVMGSNMTHSWGGEDGTVGIPFLNWSLTIGDLRIAHFVGMHALQALPLLAWFLLRNTQLTFAAFVLYSGLAVFVLVQALRGKSLI